MGKKTVREYYIDRKKVYAPVENEIEFNPHIEESILSIVKNMAQYEPKTIDDVQVRFNGNGEVHLFTLKWFVGAYIQVEVEEVKE